MMKAGDPKRSILKFKHKLSSKGKIFNFLEFIVYDIS